MKNLKYIILFYFMFCFYSQKLMAQNKTIEKIGDAFLMALPTATLATTFILKDKKGSWQFAKSLALTSAITYGLKFGVNKERPDMSNDNSFPSGHTSTTIPKCGFHSCSLWP